MVTPNGGADTITDFSDAQGDKIDLRPFYKYTSLSQLSISQVNADTVIDFGGGVTLTLTNVSSLTASDFIFTTGPIPVAGSDNIALDPALTLSITSGNLVQFTGYSGGTLTNNGGLTLAAGSNSAMGVTTVAEPDPTALFVNNGTLNVSGAGAIGIDYATTHNAGIITVTGTNATYSTIGAAGDVVNSGTMTIQGAGAVMGADDWNGWSPGGVFQNLAAGTFSVTSTAGAATGVILVYGSDFENAGEIIVSAATTGVGVSYSAWGVSNTVTNSGTISVTGATTTGIAISSSYGATTVALQNSGTITAQTAIRYSGTAANITNSSTGVINGDIVLTSANDTLTNTGTINGAVNMGGGNDTLDSHLGTINGVITLGSGSSSAALGSEDNTVALAGGTHVVDGGGGTNTVSYAGAASGVHVSLGLQGQAQGTGVGTDTLTHFQTLVGSAYGDTLEGGGSASSTLTGGAGADAFVYRAGDGNVTITDFSHAQGDRIDLSSFSSLRSFSDLQGLLSPSGSDTVLHLPGGGTVTLDGVSPGALTAADFQLSHVATDLNGDGASDMVWEGPSGQFAVWSINGAGLLSNGVPIQVPGWQVQATGDFNGDGKSGDLLLRDGSGEVVVWEMNGPQIIGSGAVMTLPNEWVLQGAADLNGDGKSDMIWRDSATGAYAFWEMNGAQIELSSGGSLPTNWHMVGSGDFNGDGKADILWRDANTGQIVDWQMNGLQVQLSYPVYTTSLAYHVAGTGDFNGDGKSDILLQGDNGQFVLWEMNGGTILSSAAIYTLPTDWTVGAIGDFNGDGRSDILLRNVDTHQIVAWEMNGATIQSSFSLPALDNSWTVANPHFDWV